MVITPIPSTDAQVPVAAKKTASKVKSKVEAGAGANAAAVATGKGEGRKARPATKNGKTALGENIDEISKLTHFFETKLVFQSKEGAHTPIGLRKHQLND